MLKYLAGDYQGAIETLESIKERKSDLFLMLNANLTIVKAAYELNSMAEEFDVYKKLQAFRMYCSRAQPSLKAERIRWHKEFIAGFKNLLRVRDGVPKTAQKNLEDLRNRLENWKGYSFAKWLQAKLRELE